MSTIQLRDCHKKLGVKILFLCSIGTLLVACNPATPIPIVTPLSPTLETPRPTPASLTSPTPELAASPSVVPSPTFTPNLPGQAAQIPVMPGAILDETSTGWGMALSQFLGQEVISYSASTSLEAVRDFYETELVAQGWEWVYTDLGESLILSDPIPVLAQEFKRGPERLAVVAIGGLGSGPDPSASLVMSGTGISSGELITFFVSLIAGGLDLGPPAESEVQPQSMRFSTELLQFDHPSNWFPTRLQMTGYQTDTNGKATHIFPEPKRCPNDNEVCFVNFAFLTRSLFDVPVRLRLYGSEAETTLEAFDARSWAELMATAEAPPTSLTEVEWPEDLIEAGSLEPIEIKAITLQDGTPALQRIYRWRQVGLSTPLVSSSTLFKRKEVILEFHTDFTEAEWLALEPDIQETILSVELIP